MSETDSVATNSAPPTTYAARRAAMADETRTRILEACVAILARGVTELSIPAVAREAGVSVPTVYRNFPDKKTLVQETAVHLKQLRGPVGPPEHLDELPGQLRRLFHQSSTAAETVRAALASEPILAAKRELGMSAQRRKQTAEFLGDALASFSPADRECAVLVTTVLCSSAMLRAFREVAGVDADEAADAVSWTIARILGRPWQTQDETSTTTREASEPTREATRSRTAPGKSRGRKGAR